MPANSVMVEAVGLTKYYGEFVAVRDVTFAVSAGEVVAVLGPNGAGKSTILKILTGFLAPSEGHVRVAGIDIAQDRLAAAEKIGYLPENGPLYLDMTPDDLLEFFGKARGMGLARRRERIAAVVELCGLEQVTGKRIAKLSRGYRQRIGLAQAMLHEPEVLVLDEPTSGLDPNQIREVRSALKQIGREKTILLSTHLFQEVEAVASRVLVIHDGALVFDGTPQELAAKDTRTGMEGAFHELTAQASREE